MLKKIISWAGIPAALKIIGRMLRELIYKSIKDPKLVVVILSLFDLVSAIAGRLTNDTKDNTKQVKEVVREEAPKIIIILQSYLNSF